MPQNTPECPLMRLPADVHTLIVAQLRVPSPLFLPIYKLRYAGFACGDLQEKHKEYYGSHSDQVLASSHALLAWSSTCSTYRTRFAPTIFSNIILRAKPTSLASINLLSNTSHWPLITSFTFVGSFRTERHFEVDCKRESEISKPLESLDFSLVSNILSNLPLNLTSLTLDLPTDWLDECDEDYLSVFNVTKSPAQTLAAERSNLYQKLIYTAFSSIIEYSLTSKSSFKLNLYNIPPLTCSMYSDPRFHQFLNGVTDLTLSFGHFDNGAGWGMNTMQVPERFASKLGEWFFNHLASVKSFSLHADDSWPIGLAPGRCHIPLALPRDGLRFTYLTHLSLKWFFIDNELVTLLSTHMSALIHLTMTNIQADGENTISEALSAPSWSTFFASLSRHPTFIYLSVVLHATSFKILDPFNHLAKGDSDIIDNVKTAHKELTSLRASQPSPSEHKGGEGIRIKVVWPHRVLDDKYGMVFDDENRNAERFNQGEDHKAWLRLCDLLEERGGRATVEEKAEEN